METPGRSSRRYLFNNVRHPGDNMRIMLNKAPKGPLYHFSSFSTNKRMQSYDRQKILFPHHRLVVYNTNTYNNLMLNTPRSVHLAYRYNVYHLHNNNLSKQNQYHVSCVWLRWCLCLLCMICYFMETRRSCSCRKFSQNED